MSSIAEFGSISFGLVIGWFLYFLNRYRRTEASFTDISTILGAIGGAAITSLFGDGKQALFGAYGIGLAIGFFSYFLFLTAMVAISKNFGVDYFLDGRRKGVDEVMYIPDQVQQPGYAFDAPGSQESIVRAAITAGVEAAKKV